jgi:hypothetical protein
VLFSAAVSANAQVYVKSLPNKAEFEKQFPQLNQVNLDNVPMIVQSPSQADLQRYKQTKASLVDENEFALLLMNVDFGMVDGVWAEKNGNRIWTLCLATPNVDRITIHFRNFYLVPNALMYIYSFDGKYVEGPYTVRNNGNKVISSEIISDGKSIIIQIIEPANSIQTSTLNIFSITAEEVETVVKNTSSANCEVDVACHPNNNFYILKTITA